MTRTAIYLIALAAVTIIATVVLVALHDAVPAYFESVIFSALVGAGVSVTPDPLAPKALPPTAIPTVPTQFVPQPAPPPYPPAR